MNRILGEADYPCRAHEQFCVWDTLTAPGMMECVLSILCCDPTRTLQNNLHPSEAWPIFELSNSRTHVFKLCLVVLPLPVK